MRPYCRKSCPPNVSKHRKIFNYSTDDISNKCNSDLCYLKTDFGIRMLDDPFDALMLMYFHRDITLICRDIVDMYARKYPRRIYCKILDQNSLCILRVKFLC